MQNGRGLLYTIKASDVNDEIVFVDKHFVGIWHTRSIAENMQNVSTLIPESGTTWSQTHDL